MASPHEGNGTASSDVNTGSAAKASGTNCSDAEDQRPSVRSVFPSPCRPLFPPRIPGPAKPTSTKTEIHPQEAMVTPGYRLAVRGESLYGIFGDFRPES
eukprot:g59703.t1